MMMKMIKYVTITAKQCKWLSQRGGRGVEDVFMDNIGFYVIMYKPSIFKGLSSESKIHLPIIK